jgi:NAD-dependent DNA ligase
VGARVDCSIPSILAMTVEDFRGIGFGPVESQNFWQEIHASGKLDNVPLHVLMTACGVFGNGIGLKKIQKITGAISNLLLEAEEASNEKKLVSKIAALSGWTTEGAQDFVDRLPEFRRFLIACPMIGVESPATTTTSQTTIQYSVVFSGFRDAELEKQLASQGIQVAATLTMGVRYLIVKDDSVTTSKTAKARQMGVKILSKEKFMKLL